MRNIKLKIEQYNLLRIDLLAVLLTSELYFTRNIASAKNGTGARGIWLLSAVY